MCIRAPTVAIKQYLWDQKKKVMRSQTNHLLRFGGIVLAGFTSLTANADAVTDWNAHWDEAALHTAQPAPAQARFGAILHVAVFDAVNGIAGKYTPYHVTEKAPPGARQEAAAIQAAHTVLRALYPSEASVLDAHLAHSLAGIPGAPGESQSIARGRAWGLYVAEQVLELRSNDGWSTPPAPYFGSAQPGVWRSIPFPGNPDGTLPAVFAQVAFLTPFAMESSVQFRPGPPYAPTLAEALASPQYAADVNEVKALGSVNSTVRTEDQTKLARLWQAMGSVDENRAARSVVPPGNKLVDNARLFALLNITACDALIASMDSKFVYNLWRPHHAIRLADTDGNPATEADPEWTALILAPRFQEYVANHACLTGAFMYSLARLLGNEQTFTLGSPNFPGFTWTFERFSDAAEQAKEARIWGGIHYRNSCEVGQDVGEAVAEYVLQNFLLPLN
jgi:hypothetical protein